MNPPTLHLSGDPEADRLLSEDPLALLIGMVLDQQVPLEWAFSSPAVLRRRLGGNLSAATIAAMDPSALAAAFSTKPALHRYPASMASRVQDLCRLLVDRYSGRADSVWQDVTSGAHLLARLRDLPGFGDQKAKIFVAFLGKQLGVRPPGWLESSLPFSEPSTFKSVADITDSASLDRVRSFKQDMKAKAKAQANAPSTSKASTSKASTSKASTSKASTSKASTSKGASKAGTSEGASKAATARSHSRAR